MLPLLRSHYAYQSWAMSNLFKALAELSPEEFETVNASGHGSIRDTLAHLLSTHAGWFSWFDGTTDAAGAMQLRITAADVPTVEAAAERWEAIREKTTVCLATLTEEGIQKAWSATAPNGLTLSLPLWQLLLHVANHGTHTRAQIVAAIRRTGRKPGVYEFLWFAASQPKLAGGE
jgi:uncharacterized damage-inducible protein DinB